MPGKGWKQLSSTVWEKRTPTAHLYVTQTGIGDWRAQYVDCGWRLLQVARVASRDEAMKRAEEKL